MKKFWNGLLILALLFYAATLIFFSFAYNEYKHLTLKDSIKKSDVIIVYGTENQAALLKKAKYALLQGYGKKIIISPFVVNEDQNSLQLLKKEKISKSDVIPDYYSIEMKQSTINVSKILSRHDWETGLIIANDYEMKRLAKTYEKNDVIHTYYYQSLKSDKDSPQYHKAASNEVWQLPKLWLNR